jgi:hypothetical protein
MEYSSVRNSKVTGVQVIHRNPTEGDETSLSLILKPASESHQQQMAVGFDNSAGIGAVHVVRLK